MSEKAPETGDHPPQGWQAVASAASGARARGAAGPGAGRGMGLLVVDMQNGFCHPCGTIAAAGHDISAQRAVVPRVAALVKACRAAGVPVFWSRQEHSHDDAGRLGHRLRTHIDKGGALPCVRGTWDAELLDELQPLVDDDDLVFSKHRASCFFDTVLGTHLRMRGVSALIVTGVATNYCVDATIRDAYARDLDLLVVEDACGCSFPDLHAATMKNVDLFHGEVVRSHELLATLRPTPDAARSNV